MSLAELCSVHEEFAMSSGRRAVVVRMASQFFVLRGARTQPLSGYRVSRPFATRADASQAALREASKSFAEGWAPAESRENA